MNNMKDQIIKEKEKLTSSIKPHYYDIGKFEIEFPYKAEGC